MNALPSNSPQAWRALERVLDTVAGRVVVFGVAVWMFLFVPDWDFALMPVLHHRSLLTHSIGPALLLGLVRRDWARAAAAGALVGTGVHLLADSLSPMVGFAQVWWPWPIFQSLGPTGSRLWLVGNGVAAFALTLRFAGRALPYPSTLPLVTAAGGAVGLLYGVGNERSLLAAALGLAAPALLWWVHPARRRANDAHD